MNDESLQRANAFLAAVSERAAVGEVLQETPAEIGRVLGLPDPLSTARAVRALIARRRLEAANGSYRLLDATPLEAGGRESMGPRPPPVSRGGASRPPPPPAGRRPSVRRRRATARPAPPTPIWAGRSPTSWSTSGAKRPNFAPSSARSGKKRVTRVRRATKRSNAPDRSANARASSKAAPRWLSRTSARCSRPLAPVGRRRSSTTHRLGMRRWPRSLGCFAATRTSRPTSPTARRRRRLSSPLRLLVDVDQVTGGEVLVADGCEREILAAASILDPELLRAA